MQLALALAVRGAGVPQGPKGQVREYDAGITGTVMSPRTLLPEPSPSLYGVLSLGKCGFLSQGSGLRARVRITGLTGLKTVAVSSRVGSLLQDSRPSSFPPAPNSSNHRRPSVGIAETSLQNAPFPIGPYAPEN